MEEPLLFIHSIKTNIENDNNQVHFDSRNKLISESLNKKISSLINLHRADKKVLVSIVLKNKIIKGYIKDRIKNKLEVNSGSELKFIDVNRISEINILEI